MGYTPDLHTTHCTVKMRWRKVTKHILPFPLEESILPLSRTRFPSCAASVSTCEKTLKTHARSEPTQQRCTQKTTHLPSLVSDLLRGRVPKSAACATASLGVAEATAEEPSVLAPKRLAARAAFASSFLRSFSNFFCALRFGVKGYCQQVRPTHSTSTSTSTTTTSFLPYFLLICSAIPFPPITPPMNSRSQI